MLDADRKMPRETGERSRCDECSETVISKVGEHVIAHWAHEAGSTCVASGTKGAWHTAWQIWAVRQGANIEVKMGKNRADIVWPDGRIYEIQSKAPSSGTIRNREKAYGDRLTWLYPFNDKQWGQLWQGGGNGRFIYRRASKLLPDHERPIEYHHQDRLFRLRQRPEVVPQWKILCHCGGRSHWQRGDCELGNQDDGQWVDEIVITLTEESPGVYSKPAPFDLDRTRLFLSNLAIAAV